METIDAFDSILDRLEGKIRDCFLLEKEKQDLIVEKQRLNAEIDDLKRQIYELKATPADNEIPF